MAENFQTVSEGVFSETRVHLDETLCLRTGVRRPFPFWLCLDPLYWKSHS